jgi:hypothetical protein
VVDPPPVAQHVVAQPHERREQLDAAVETVLVALQRRRHPVELLERGPQLLAVLGDQPAQLGRQPLRMPAASPIPGTSSRSGRACAAGHRRSRSAAACSAVSTPSAISVAPVLCGERDRSRQRGLGGRCCRQSGGVAGGEQQHLGTGLGGVEFSRPSR